MKFGEGCSDHLAESQRFTYQKSGTLMS